MTRKPWSTWKLLVGVPIWKNMRLWPLERGCSYVRWRALARLFTRAGSEFLTALLSCVGDLLLWANSGADGRAGTRRWQHAGAGHGCGRERARVANDVPLRAAPLLVRAARRCALRLTLHRMHVSQIV